MNENILDIMDFLKKGCLIFVKNGIINTVDPLDFGEITFHFQNGQIDRTTTKTSKKI